jgi:hypothetical protein
VMGMSLLASTFMLQELQNFIAHRNISRYIFRIFMIYTL